MACKGSTELNRETELHLLNDVKFAATRRVLWTLSVSTIHLRSELGPEPRWGAYSAPQTL